MLDRRSKRKITLREGEEKSWNISPPDGNISMLYSRRMNNLRRGAVAGFLTFSFGCGLLIASTSTPSDPLGTVIAVEGNWHIVVDGTGAVTVGLPVTAAMIVKRDPPLPTSYGSISVLLKGGKRATYSCHDPETLPDPENKGCVQPISFKMVGHSAEEQNAQANSLLAAVVSLFSHGSQEYYSAVSRDAGSLEDAVVEKKGDAIDFDPAFGALNQGDYTLAVEKMSGNAPTAATPAAVKVSWDPDKKRMTNAPALQEGLYRIRVDTSDKEMVGQVWILVASTESFEKKKASFQSVQDTTAGWSGKVPASGIHAVQRAALDALSRGATQ